MIKLNLLSPVQKEYLRFEHTYFKLRSVLFLVLAFTSCASMVLLGARLLLQDNLAELLTTSTVVSNHDRPIDRNISTINSNLRDVEHIQKKFVKWSQTLVAITAAVPANVQVSYLNLELSTNSFNLNGLARRREDFLALLSNLQKLPQIEALNSPPANLVNRENVSFQLTAKLKTEALTQ